MSAPTPSQIKDRVRLLVGQVSGVASSQDDYLPQDAIFSSTQLPAAVTWLHSTQFAPLRVTRREAYEGTVIERWEIPIILHVCVASNTDVLSPNTTEMELCEPFLRSVPSYFLQRKRLHCAALGLGDLVYDTEPMASSGVIKIERPKVTYWGVVYILPVLEEVTV